MPKETNNIKSAQFPIAKKESEREIEAESGQPVAAVVSESNNKHMYISVA